MKFTERDGRLIYHVFLGSILISLNLFFLAFVHYKFDYSPNFALAISTLPFAFFEIKKAFRIVRPKETK